jgi:dUTP pyrophosphatase
MNNDIYVKINRIHPDAITPEYANYDDSGADVFLIEDIAIPPEGTTFSNLGFTVEIPYGYELQFRSKSGLAKNKNLFILNAPGTIDAGYRGEVAALVSNFGTDIQFLKKGTKVGQLVLCPVYHAVYREDNRSGGFGSTGVESAFNRAVVPIGVVPVDSLKHPYNRKRTSENWDETNPFEVKVDTGDSRPSLRIC